MDTQDNPTAGRKRRALIAGATLALITVVFAIATTLLAQATRARIERNEQASLRERLDALVSRESYDNDPLADRIDVIAPDLLGTAKAVSIYRARHNASPVAAFIRSIAPDGYRGAIELLIAIAPDGHLIGVQVLQHQETPGLGDAFENRAADWLPKFAGMSLSNPPQNRWTVRKDGGDFDAFTGATITPRAIVKAVRRSLEYYQANRERIWEPGNKS
jgi:electron transport complex protein RnfG